LLVASEVVSPYPAYSERSDYKMPFTNDATLHDIQLHDIQARDMSHAERMKELIARPAPPAPFPEDLPDRAPQPKSWWKTRKLLFVILIAIGLIALGGIAVLAYLYYQEHTNLAAAHSMQRSLETQLSDARAHPRMTTLTETAKSTVTNTETVTQTEVSTITVSSKVFETVTITTGFSAGGQKTATVTKAVTDTVTFFTAHWTVTTICPL
jgi:ABC-type multidrug transport system fused ATPase/permease subunit